MEGYPQARHGHPKDGRPDLKQIQAGPAVTGEGGIPVFHRAYSGGAAEVAQVVGAMTALRKLSAQRDLLMVGDSELISYPNVTALLAAGVRFVAPCPAAQRCLRRRWSCAGSWRTPPPTPPRSAPRGSANPLALGEFKGHLAVAPQVPAHCPDHRDLRGPAGFLPD
ncbi:hypothetical protein [Streptomyces sp. CBMA123]|uniref:hypothetical protein n=1 Tax=Streptomyces sp. CBMA123 TaxID=1896313 RepID=UPI001661FA08|nr:hypothetical protein [Streptomyces sp. CBMA123]